MESYKLNQDNEEENVKRLLKGMHFRKSLPESERGDRFWSKKFLKIIEHVSYSIRYCKISLLIYSGSSSLSNGGHF